MEQGRRRGRRLALVAATTGIVGAAAAAAWLWLRPHAAPAPPVGAQAGATIAAGAVGAIALAEEIREPYRCARWRAEPSATDAGPVDAGVAPEPEVVVARGRRIERSGRALRVGGGDRRLVVGFVADARGADEHTLAHIAAARRAFETQGVELVVSLGGMGRDQEELTAVLDALARDAQWPLIALPGARESLPAHRAAVAAVADTGRAVVFDGASVRVVAMDGVVIGTVPGVAEPGQLIAGNDGCVHDTDELVAFAEDLARLPEPRLLASYAPPRQRGETASDVGASGVHIGEPGLAVAVATAEPLAVVHGLVDEAADDDASERPRRATSSPTIIGAGAIEGLPLWTDDERVLGASAVVVTVANGGLSWRRVRLPVPVD